mgnify:CR=1 FL=1
MHIETFDSFEEMNEQLQKRQEEAWKNTSESQKTLLDGKKRWFVYVETTYSPENIWIYGEIESTDERRKQRDEGIAALDPNSDDYNELAEEYIYEFDVYEEQLTRGFVFGRCYSIVEPSGELGSTHVSKVAQISESVFNEAKSTGWKPNQRAAISIAIEAQQQRG